MDPPQPGNVRDDDGERQQDERLWADRERMADEGKARRAREMLELMRQKEIEQKRMSAGLCVFCGRRLSIVQRLFRADKHRGCRNFTE